MIIYLNNKFEPVDKKDAVIAKVIPDNGSTPYFVLVNNEDKPKDNA